MYLFEDDVYPLPMQAAFGPSGFGGAILIENQVTSAVVMAVSGGSIGAPGVGIAWRPILVAATYRPNNTGNIEIFGQVGKLPYCLNIGPTQHYASFVIPEPGFQIPANVGISFDHRSNVASQAFDILFYLMIDTVN